MLVLHEKCIICGYEMDLNLNTKKENMTSDNFYITRNIGNKTFECEIEKRCPNCSMKNKYIKNIKLD